MEKKIVIYGAGKIGRGFVADVFASGGYRLLFVDSNAALVDALRTQKQYTLCNVRSADDHEKKLISDYDVMLNTDERLEQAIQQTGLLALVVFPDVFNDVAKTIASIIKKKAVENDQSPLDIIVFANIVSPQQILREKVYAVLPESLHAFADEVMSIIGTLVIRIAVQPSEEMYTEDPLTVLTDGHAILPIENHFKGERPDCPMLEYHDSLEVLEKRKLYTYNMAHAATAYLGMCKRCATISDALSDPEIEQIVRGALAEVGLSFVREYDFSEEEMAQHNNSVIKKFKNPLLNDTPVRVGANPIRKLSYTDRIVGAALLARRNGIYPYYLLKAVAYGFMFHPAEDAAAAEIRRYIMENGIDKAIRKYTQLHEPDVIYTIKRHYIAADGKFAPENATRVNYLKRAYEAGFFSEKKYRGCAQGILAALTEVTGIENKDIFRAATGFSGGMALCGDGVCGGYSGGQLFMGYLKGRDFDRISIDGDKENQYFAYDCSQLLHDHFVACFGSPVCMRIHEGMFQGEHFILRTKARRNEFEDAGAHTVVCTTVVALACVWVVEILLDKGILTEKRGVE